MSDNGEDDDDDR